MNRPPSLKGRRLDRRPAPEPAEIAAVDGADAPLAGAPPVPIGATGSAAQQQDMAQQGAGAAVVASSARPKSPLARAEILSGPIHLNVLKVALPSVATMLLQTTNAFLDRFFVGRLNAGADALAAITVSSSLMFALMSAAMAISVGTTALVSRFVGEEDREQAEQAARQSLLLSVLMAAAVSALVWLIREPLLAALGLKPGPRLLALGYLNWTLLGLPSLFAMLILNGTFRGLGDTTRPFWVSLGANVVHAIFNYLLIFGNWGFPRLGLPGGALALVISQVVALGLYLYFLRRTPLRGVLSLRRLRRNRWLLDRDWSWRIARIGLPAAAQQLLRVGSMISFQGILLATSGGTAAVAALGVGLVSESIAFMPGFGYAIAASAFVGQNLGARQVKRAHQGAWAATLQAMGVMTLMGLVFYFMAEPFARLFASQENPTPAQRAEVEETVRLAVAYLRIAIWSEPFLALGMVLTGALQGAGETKTPTLLTAATMIGLRLPLAWLLATQLGLGAVGGWWAMTLTTIVQGLLTFVIFRQGRWHRVRV